MRIYLFDDHMASCNGLILISHEETGKLWTIWNPLTGERHCLPRPRVPSHLDLSSFDACGFGYDRDTDDYKVVILFREKDFNQTLVYSLKSGSWSMTEACPCNLEDFHAVFWNGALYWRSWDDIVAFHLGTQRYGQLPLPPVDLFDRHRLDALGGCLICTLDNSTERSFDGWVMKDSRVWIKLFSLPYSMFRPVSGKLKIVAYLKRKEQVIIKCHEVFLWFDIRNESVLKFSIHDSPNINFSIICPGSLVRLSFRRRARAATIGTRMLTRKRKRDMETAVIFNSLKLCVRDVRDKCCSDNHLCSEDSCTLCKEE